jgi:hypothetical protein
MREKREDEKKISLALNWHKLHYTRHSLTALPLDTSENMIGEPFGLPNDAACAA